MELINDSKRYSPMARRLFEAVKTSRMTQVRVDIAGISEELF